MLNQKRAWSENGFSLVELMVSLVIASILGGVVLNLVTSTQKAADKHKIMLNTQALTQDLRRYAFHPEGLNRAAAYLPANRAYRACIFGGPPGSNACVAGATLPVTLFGRLPGNMSVPTESYRLAATPPLYYNAEGARCQDPGPGCFIEARASFVARCRDSTLRCDRADTVTITATFRRIAEPQGLKDFSFATITETKTYAAEEIVSMLEQQCAAGFKQIGRNEKGEPLCQVASGPCGTTGTAFFGISTTGLPMCNYKGPDLSCGVFEAAVGIDREGRPICQRLPYSMPDQCTWSSWSGSKAECPAGTVSRGVQLRCDQKDVVMGCNSVGYRLKCCQH